MPRYYDDLQDQRPVPCVQLGRVRRGSRARESFPDLFEIDCPSCGNRMGTTTYPTLKESRENWHTDSSGDRLIVELVERSADTDEPTETPQNGPS